MAEVLDADAARVLRCAMASLHSLLRLSFVLGAVALAGCAASRSVAPVGKGRHAFTASFGGPFVEFAGAAIPLPFASVGYRYGVSDRTSVHTSTYLSGPIIFGIGGLDVGINHMVLDAKGARPRLMFDVTNYFFFGDNRATGEPGDPPGGFRWIPDITLLMSWDLGEGRNGRPPHRIYIAWDSFVQLVPTPTYTPSAILGTELQADRNVGVQLELSWVAPFTNTTTAAPVWFGPGNQGAVAAKIGLQFRIPRKGERRRDLRAAEAAMDGEPAPRLHPLAPEGPPPPPDPQDPSTPEPAPAPAEEAAP